MFWSQPSGVEEHSLCSQEWEESESAFEEPYAFGTVISLLEPPLPHLENGHSNNCLVVMLEGLMKWVVEYRTDTGCLVNIASFS